MASRDRDSYDFNQRWSVILITQRMMITPVRSNMRKSPRAGVLGDSGSIILFNLLRSHHEDLSDRLDWKLGEGAAGHGCKAIDRKKSAIVHKYLSMGLRLFARERSIELSFGKLRTGTGSWRGQHHDSVQLS